ncbi:thiolase-like protein [Hysterangium stoloniferum]|nr:thiolase-like protein [Hysterangium stoloniferum]
MDLTHNSPCIIGSACRLPGGVLRTDSLWPILDQGRWQASSTLPPPSRGFPPYSPSGDAQLTCSGRGGWLGEEGVENFDPVFFDISPSEATTLRPNIRLALELTHEALENAGIPPSSLRGKHVSVSIGVGTEDGWDMKRWNDDAFDAFDSNWAASSDPSGIPGHVAHFFDFRGSCNTVSNACASGTFALRDAIFSLYHENAEIAIVGSLATHFSSAPFRWAAAAGVASCSGRSAAFSPHADGYSPSEGAVFFVLKRYNAAQVAGDHIQGVIRALETGHNGKMRSLITPNTTAQVELARRLLKAAKLQPSDVTLLEAHGTGTPVGDALEAEGIRSMYEPTRSEAAPLLLSSSKTVFGHCHGAASFVGQ